MAPCGRIPPKTLGGDRTFVLEILPTPFLSALHIGPAAENKPLFMRCGPYRALLELKMLWPHAIGTPENPRGGIELKILPPLLGGLERSSQCYSIGVGE